MRQKRTLLLSMLLLPILVVSVGLIGCGAEEAPVTLTEVEHKPVELKMWSMAVADVPPASPIFERFTGNVNSLGKDVNLSIKVIGGPEICPAFEGMSSLQGGVFDVAFIASTFFSGVIPEAMATIADQYTPWEARRRGTLDAMNEFYHENGVHLLGAIQRGYQFQLYLTELRETPDLSGLQIWSLPFWNPFIEALGGTPIVLEFGEVYSALETGMVQGYGMDENAGFLWGWTDFIKCIWGPPFYSVEGLIVINLDKWNSLDKYQQLVLETAVRLSELEEYIVLKGDIKRVREALLEAGIKDVTFTEPEREWFLDTAYDEYWKWLLELAPRAAEVRPLLEK